MSTALIYKLPDELLAEIFLQVVFESTNTNTSSQFALASVSHHFRRVCLQTARLWSTVSFHQRPEARNLCLARSKDAKLCVHLLFDEKLEGYGSFLSDVIPHARRWKEFHFKLGDSTHKKWVYILASISVICSQLVLPQLKVLRITFALEHPWDGMLFSADDNQKAELLHFYKTWRTPRLKRLTTENLIPLHTGSECLKSASITICGLNLQGNGGRVASLLSIASSWQSLKKLAIHLGEEPILEPLPPIFLPCAEDIKIGLTLGGTADSPMPNRVMDALHMPHIRRLTIEYVEGPCLNLDLCIASFFPAHNTYVALTSLCIRNKPSAVVGLALGDASVDCFNFLMGRLPHVQHLTLELATFVPPKNLYARLPPLRSLRIFDSKWVDMAFVRMVANGLQQRMSMQTDSDSDSEKLQASSNSTGFDFELMEVNTDSRVSKADLLQVFPGALVARNQRRDITCNGKFYDVWRVETRGPGNQTIELE